MTNSATIFYVLGCLMLVAIVTEGLAPVRRESRQVNLFLKFNNLFCTSI